MYVCVSFNFYLKKTNFFPALIPNHMKYVMCITKISPKFGPTRWQLHYIHVLYNQDKMMTNGLFSFMNGS